MEVAHKPHLHQDWIDPHAFGIVKALQRAGFQSYLVGGCVRDLLLGLHPKDYDIATIAQPKEVKNLIYNSYIIGRRFLLVLAKRDQQQYEIATFRKETKIEEPIEGDEPAEAPAGDNTFGTPEEDARRRDFTINALFYDPVNEDLIDYVDALKDIETRTLRMIGNPDVRFVEDPIRLLRALRFSHKLELFLEEELRESMKRNAASIAMSVLPRRREEILKLLRLHEPFLAFIEAYDLGILEHLSPFLNSVFSDDEARENFRFYLDKFKPIIYDNVEPQYLLTWIVLAAAYATAEGDWPTGLQMRADNMQNFLRNELGMFKMEQSFLGHTLQLSGMLQKTAQLKKRGARRLMSILKNESFEASLRLVELNYEIPIEDILFWRNAANEAAAEISAHQAEQRGKKPMRPRRRRRKPTPA